MTPLAARKWVVLWLAAEPMIDRLATDTVPNSQAWSRVAENGSKQTTYVEKQPCRRKEWVLNSPSPLVLAKVDIYPIKEGLTIPATPSQKDFVSALLNLPHLLTSTTRTDFDIPWTFHLLFSKASPSIPIAKCRLHSQQTRTQLLRTLTSKPRSALHVQLQNPPRASPNS